ncbi:MAG TPA: hypothetical protein VGM52_08470 [Herbaspirillum sp.]|jgi:hypothetical protein
MESRNDRRAELIIVSESEYYNFIQKLPELIKFCPDISTLRNDEFLGKVVAVAGHLFSKKIARIKHVLDDPEAGVIALDIAEGNTLSADENAYWGVLIAQALGANVFQPAKDSENETPYTVYAASYEKSKTLAGFGLATVAPETKLGFHTDGTIRNSQVFMPHNIMLYNILIEYRKAGNFYWVPFSLWAEKKKFMEQIGIGRRYRIKVTPSIYERDGGKMDTVTPLEIEAPLFVADASYDFPLYINGNVLGVCDGEIFDRLLIDQLKDSIESNKVRYAVPQKSRRAIFARNLAGAHSRDVFEEPIPNVPYTRLFMRSVDTNTISLND